MGKEVDKLVAQLREENSLKVWSLIITFFGDAVVARGGNVSAKTVQAVLSGMHIGSGAVRTAFSRLVSDQWIVRKKIGRESFYELADNGYRPFKAATARIYSAHSAVEPESNHWTLAVNDSRVKVADFNLPEGGVLVGANCWLFQNLECSALDSLANHEFLTLSGELSRLPGWLTDKIGSDDFSKEYALLQKRFAAVEQVTKLDLLDNLIGRCLLIHQWRRLLLRSPVVPDALRLPEQECRQFVAGLYSRLLPGSEAWLDEYATCANGKIPGAATDIKHRFTDKFV